MDWPEPPDLPFVVAPDADTLLARMGRLLQVGDLAEIADCDHGWRASEHLDGLRRILAGDMPRPLRMCPAEVLRLTHWSEPDAGLGPYIFEAAHRRRAFACAALLRSLGDEKYEEADGGGEVMGPNTALIQLVASLRVFGDEHDAAAAAFLQWLIPRIIDFDEAAFFGIALLWFVLPAPAGVADSELVALADWVMAADRAAADGWRALFGADAMHTWLLGTTNYDLRHEVWRDFAGWLEARAASRPALRETVALMAAAMREPPRDC